MLPEPLEHREVRIVNIERIKHQTRKQKIAEGPKYLHHRRTPGTASPSVNIAQALPGHGPTYTPGNDQADILLDFPITDAASDNRVEHHMNQVLRQINLSGLPAGRRKEEQLVKEVDINNIGQLADFLQGKDTEGNPGEQWTSETTENKREWPDPTEEGEMETQKDNKGPHTKARSHEQEEREQPRQRQSVGRDVTNSDRMKTPNSQGVQTPVQLDNDPFVYPGEQQPWAGGEQQEFLEQLVKESEPFLRHFNMEEDEETPMDEGGEDNEDDEPPQPGGRTETKDVKVCLLYTSPSPRD